MTREALVQQIQAKQSFLCVGLDPHMDRLPAVVLEEAKDTGEHPLLVFNRAIIAATHELCVAYKPNLAFYECHGPAGLEALAATRSLIPNGCLTIADAKRGDIGNTATMYAKTFFETGDFDAVTVAPYMGEDSVKPFLSGPGKWVIVLGLTSNPGANDFQMTLMEDGQPLFAHVISKTAEWGSPNELMFVVGATRGERIKQVRTLAPNHFFLVPGVGKQGGSLAEVAQYGMNDQCGLLVNSSRGIIHASSGPDFATRAREEAQKLQEEMAGYLKNG